jgi:hypothetical protein
MKKILPLVICLLSPFLIVVVFVVLAGGLVNFGLIKNSSFWPFCFVVVGSSFIPLYSMKYVKKSYLRIILGSLIVPFYIFLFGWIFYIILNFEGAALG